MRAVKQKNTKPELLVRQMLHARGWRYRLHRKGLPGTPDIVFPSRKKALFVHGCFWHGHDCRLGRMPETRRDFWVKKASDNRERDARVQRQLTERGWDSLVVWQCELKNSNALTERIETFLGKRLDPFEDNGKTRDNEGQKNDCV